MYLTVFDNKSNQCTQTLEQILSSPSGQIMRGESEGEGRVRLGGGGREGSKEKE